MTEMFSVVSKILIAILLILSLLLISKFTSKTESSACRDCNVILISIDTLRADHLGLYGYQKNTSPNLDRWARNSRVLKNFYVTAPWTLPSHASMFASNYPYKLKMQLGTDMLADEHLTIAEVMRQNGYKTVGWDSGTFVSKRWNFDQGFDEYREVDAGNLDGGEKWQDADLIFPDAIDWIEKNKNKKFFAFIHTFQVHDPYCPPAEFDKFKENYEGNLKCIDIDVITEQNRGKKNLSSEDLKRYISLYDGEILYTDFYLGKLFDAIEKLGIDEKTIIVITSDHGEEFGERKYWGVHTYSLYNELVRVPLIIKAPNIKPGFEENSYFMIDIAPTILDILGIRKPEEFRGISVRDVRARPIYFDTSTPDSVIETLDKAYAGFSSLKPFVRKENKGKAKEGVISGEWKLIIDRLPQAQLKQALYNIKSDPMEKDNLIGKGLPVEETLKKLILANFIEETKDENSFRFRLEDIGRIFRFILPY